MNTCDLLVESRAEKVLHRCFLLNKTKSVESQAATDLPSAVGSVRELVFLPVGMHLSQAAFAIQGHWSRPRAVSAI